MKKALLLNLFLAILTQLAAQDHIRVLGIPLNGTIEQFAAKLTQKGFVPDNSDALKGQRKFQGRWFGAKTELVVWYESGSKRVFEAKMFMDFATKQKALEFVEIFDDVIKTKYPATDGLGVRRMKGYNREINSRELYRAGTNTAFGMISFWTDGRNKQRVIVSYNDYDNYHFYVRSIGGM